MTLNDPQLLRRIQKKASQSPCIFNVAAYGFNRKGEIVSKKMNLPRFDRRGGGKHAEMRVMEEAKQKGIISILICRVNNTGDLLPISPCNTCQRRANKLGIKIHSIKEGDK